MSAERPDALLVVARAEEAHERLGHRQLRDQPRRREHDERGLQRALHRLLRVGRGGLQREQSGSTRAMQ
jgi:hypothetical protein